MPAASCCGWWRGAECALPIVNSGKQRYFSSTSKITDSGAAATAIASGQKTYNKAIGVDADGEPIANIVEFASGREMATGVISTSSITHATPACFYAHNIDRYNYEMIAQDLPPHRSPTLPAQACSISRSAVTKTTLQTA